jgi:hypothetical protein
MADRTYRSQALTPEDRADLEETRQTNYADNSGLRSSSATDPITPVLMRCGCGRPSESTRRAVAGIHPAGRDTYLSQ